MTKARDESMQLRVYRPDSRFADSAWTALSHLIGELWTFRSHIWTIFSQEFRNSYRGSRLGVFWNFALPILPVTVYVFLAAARVLPQFEGVDAAVYITIGVTIWFLFAGCVQQPITIVRGRNAETMKTSLPLSAIIGASFARLLFETLIRLGLVVVVALAMRAVPAATAPLALLVLAAGVVFSIAVGLIASILNIVYPDVERVVTVAMQYGIFLSGVIFPVTALGPLSILAWLNPFAVFITAIRDLLFLGFVPNGPALAVMSCLGLALTLVAGRLFYIMEQRIRGVV